MQNDLMFYGNTNTHGFPVRSVRSSRKFDFIAIVKDFAINDVQNKGKNT